MVAVVRGRASNGAKTRARTATKGGGRSVAAAVRPSKFRGAAAGAGLPPRLALYAASGAVILCTGVILLTGDRLALAGAGLEGMAASALGGFGFRLQSLQVTGASSSSAERIAAATGLDNNTPILGVDLEAVRARVEQVGWVETASVLRLLPNTIKIEVVERAPVAVWQMNGQMRVIDAQGQVIADADAGRFPELPLVVGAGANEAGGAVFDLVRARPRLAERLEALVRVDGRRWDLRLKDGSIIQLPAVGEAEAMISLDQLDQNQGILDLGFERIDLRSLDMVVVRRPETLTRAALPAGDA